uniref:Uncharacterized protein n=1 Tax=Anser cygnoides TaxID=8845 RepID=A0A8B9ERY5_ANSCY
MDERLLRALGGLSLQPPPRRRFGKSLVLLRGLPGSGKSTLASKAGLRGGNGNGVWEPPLSAAGTCCWLGRGAGASQEARKGFGASLLQPRGAASRTRCPSHGGRWFSGISAQRCDSSKPLNHPSHGIWCSVKSTGLGLSILWLIADGKAVPLSRSENCQGLGLLVSCCLSPSGVR